MAGIVEWLWRSERMRAANVVDDAVDPARRAAFVRALAAMEAAELATHPVTPLHSGSSLVLGVSLWREAVGWALAGHMDGAPKSPLELFLAARPETLRAVTENEDELNTLRHDLTPVAREVEVLLREDEHLARADRLARFTRRLVQGALRRDEEVAAALRERWSRVGGVVIALALVVAAVPTIRDRLDRRPDLAAGKPWKTSSSEYQCHPEKRDCAGIETVILFHTKDEPSPWFEIDLGAAQSFSTVDVFNRTDCCRDRGHPIVVEVSDDAKAWREVARRTTEYTRWKANFATTRARYVRLRLLKHAVLHLEKVVVKLVAQGGRVAAWTRPPKRRSRPDAGSSYPSSPKIR